MEVGRLFVILPREFLLPVDALIVFGPFPEVEDILDPLFSDKRKLVLDARRLLALADDTLDDLELRDAEIELGPEAHSIGAEKFVGERRPESATSSSITADLLA